EVHGMTNIRKPVSVQQSCRRDAGGITGAEVVNHGELPAFKGAGQQSGAVAQQKLVRPDWQFNSPAGPQGMARVIADIGVVGSPIYRIEDRAQSQVLAPVVRGRSAETLDRTHGGLDLQGVIVVVPAVVVISHVVKLRVRLD